MTDRTEYCDVISVTQILLYVTARKGETDRQ